MKKLPLLLSALLLLCSCSKSENAINVIYNLDEEVSMQELSAREVKTLLDNNYSFFLYVYSPNCSHCRAVSGYFTEYFKKHPYQLYKYNPDDISEYNTYLYANYSRMFPEEFSVPRLLVIKNASSYTEVNSYRLTNEKLFPSTVSSFAKEKEVFTGKTLYAYQTYLTKVSDPKVYHYDSSSAESVNEYQTKLNNNDLNGYFVIDTYFNDIVI